MLADRIVWENYEALDFQRFCNALLSFEVSKSFIPFNAPGKDTGYDGRFEGVYGERSGVWKFQYKFFKTARKTAFSSLKSKLDDEMHKVGNEVSNIIILTNIEVLPQERQEVLDKAKQILEQLGKGQVHFDLWDGAKLYTLSLQYPIIKLWLEERFTTAQMQPFSEEYFSTLTDSSFIGRGEALAELRNFLANDSTLLTVTGAPGIGKTRLCKEFLDDTNSKDDWTVLIVIAHTIDFDKINVALSGSRNYLIFIDDAHEYEPATIADFFRLAELHRSNRVKVLITARNFFYKNVLSLLKEFERRKVVEKPLDKLSPEETKEVFTQSLKGFIIKDYLSDFIAISRGRPILIAVIVSAIRNKQLLSTITKDRFLIDYVTDSFSGFINTLSSKTGVEQLKFRNLLAVFCLIEPLSLPNSEVLTWLAKNEEIQIVAVEMFFEELKHFGLASGKYELSIKPDYYSDILLKEQTSAWVIRTVEKYQQFTHHIISNLSALEEAVDEKPVGDSLLDSLLLGQIQELDSGSALSIQTILNTIDQVAYLKPAIALHGVEKFISISQNSEHPLSDRITSEITQERNHSNGYSRSIKSILYTIAYHLNFVPSVIDCCFQLYDLTKDKSIFRSVIGFSVRDYRENHNCERQLLYLAHIQRKSANLTPEAFDFIVTSLDDLLKLSFTITTTDIIERYKIQVTTYYIPEAKRVKELRRTVIEFAIKLFTTSKEDSHKSKLLDLLLDIPRELGASSRNKVVYKGRDEIALVFEFLQKTVEDGVSLEFQQKILEHLYRYKRWSVVKEFATEVKALEAAMAPNTLAERLVSLFTRALEEIDLDYKQSEELFKQKSAQIIEENSSPDLATSLLEIYDKYSGLPPHHYTIFLGVLYEFPEKTREVFSIVYPLNKPFVYQYGCVFLRVLYFKYKDQDFFWKYIDELSQDEKAYNAVLFIYSYLDEEWYAKLSKRDIELIISIAEKQLPENFNHLSYALPTILVADSQEGVKQIATYLEVCSQQNADNLFMSLAHNFPTYTEELKTLVLNHTVRFSLSYQIEYALRNVLAKYWEQDGFDEVFAYLLRRYVYKLNSGDGMHPRYYETVPIGDRNTLLQDRTEAEKVQIFKGVLQWFILPDKEPIANYFRKSLLEYLQPSNYITEELYLVYHEIISNISEKTPLMQVAASLEIFEDKSQYQVTLIAQILALAEGIDLFSSDEYRFLLSELYSALTSTGVKSGTPGQPFPVDLELQKFLNEQLTKFSSDSQVNRLLQDALKSVNNDIARDVERDEIDW